MEQGVISRKLAITINLFYKNLAKSQLGGLWLHSDPLCDGNGDRSWPIIHVTVVFFHVYRWELIYKIKLKVLES